MLSTSAICANILGWKEYGRGNNKLVVVFNALFHSIISDIWRNTMGRSATQYLKGGIQMNSLYELSFLLVCNLYDESVVLREKIIAETDEGAIKAAREKTESLVGDIRSIEVLKSGIVITRLNKKEGRTMDRQKEEKECEHEWEYFGPGPWGWGGESEYQCSKCLIIVPYCIAHGTMCSNDHSDYPK